MKKFSVIALVIAMFFASTNHSHSSHLIGGDISVEHVNSWDYQVNLRLYRDMSGISNPLNANVDIIRRSDAQLMLTVPMTRDSLVQMTNTVIGCGTLNFQEVGYYSAMVTLDSNVYNHPEGYYFIFSSSSRNGGIINVPTFGASGTSVVTLFPPVAYANGAQIINNSPVLKEPAVEIAVRGLPYTGDFSAYDADGDSLVYELFTPFDNSQVVPGNYNGIFFNGKDPFSQISSIQWSNCYDQANQINGISDPSCTSLTEPDRLQIDPQTGILTVSPAFGPAYYTYGVWCQEFRNGVLIGSVFRDYQLQVMANNNPANQAPTVHLPQLQSLANWSGDTIIFTGSPVCVQLNVTDPDPIADVEIEVVYSDYDTGDIVFLQNSAIINHPDSFKTALCFQPDSFVANTTRAEVVALNPGCYDLRGDTLPFFFKFVGYSNAGWGGNKTFVLPGVPNSGFIDLFPILTSNPIAGGFWVDKSNTGRLQNGSEFDMTGIPLPSTFDFYYIQQQPNYPPDTAMLTLNFVMPVGLEEIDKAEIEIYPNPANESISMVVHNEIQNKTLQIYDLQGNILHEALLESGKNVIDIRDYPEGLYFYRFENQRGKFLIQR